MTEDLPEPLVPADVDLRDFQFMPLDVRRLLTSETWLTCSGDEKAAAMTLWLESWHQVPAGSLPANEKMLAILSQATSKWTRVRGAALRHWIKCSDGRLYHPVVCEKVMQAWHKKIAQKERSRRGNEARWGIQDAKDACGSRSRINVPRRVEEVREGSEGEPSDHICDEPRIQEGSQIDPIRIAEGLRKDSRNDPKGQGQGERDSPPQHPSGASAPPGVPPSEAPNEPAEQARQALASIDKTEKGKSNGRRPTKLPQDWQPSAEDRDYAKQRGWADSEIDDMRDSFVYRFTAGKGRNATHLLWSGGNGAWGTWVRNQERFGHRPAAPAGPDPGGGRARRRGPGGGLSAGLALALDGAYRPPG